MKHKLLVLMYCVLAMMFLTGCLGGSSSSSGSSSGGGGGDIAGLPGGGGNPPVGLPQNPEPATILLLGSGFAAYVLMKRKKK